ncbi:MAG: hypothetical protein ACRED1_13320 [Limisphaerales bacterium]
MFAAIYVPHFSLQAVLRADPDLRAKAVALLDPDMKGTPVVQATDAAAKAGVTAGLTPAQATARRGDLILKARSRAREQSATEVLLQTAGAFSPNVESTGLGICTIELTRLGLRDPADAEKYGAKIVQALAPFYLDANIGIAATPELALLAARGNLMTGGAVVVVQSAKDFVAHLPVAALDPAPENWRHSFTMGHPRRRAASGPWQKRCFRASGSRRARIV